MSRRGEWRAAWAEARRAGEHAPPVLGGLTEREAEVALEAFCALGAREASDPLRRAWMARTVWFWRYELRPWDAACEGEVAVRDEWTIALCERGR